ncbi:MAG: hypothetical protein IJ265_08620 [Oscillospiraceae bacterium]|nr:hypothetical protein [Oscillospiraceae bacterium]
MEKSKSRKSLSSHVGRQKLPEKSKKRLHPTEEYGIMEVSIRQMQRIDLNGLGENAGAVNADPSKNEREELQ